MPETDGGGSAGAEHVHETRSEMSGPSRDVIQAGQIIGDVHFHGDAEPEHAAAITPRQLPSDILKFVNRDADLRWLNDVLEREVKDMFAANVYIIVGTAGVGKTALAVHWAHQIKNRFPDGQLYINLRGYDPGAPVSAPEALARFLAALGAPSAAIPADTDAAAAMYRSTLADRRVLVVLDNAATVSQVRPLIPGNSWCLAIITSRNRLSGLTAQGRAERLSIETLAERECITLLKAVTEGYRSDDEARLADLARLCAHLPLALRIAGERAATHPYMHLEELISELRDQSALWDALSIEEGGEEYAVRSVFAWSYRSLAPDVARLFRLLGLNPGRDFGIHLVCALAEVSVRRARQLLDGLVAVNMLEQTAPDRYEFHDLLRAYAIDQAQVEESADSRTDAVRRILDWYLYTADQAQGWIMPARDHVALETRPDAPRPSFNSYDEAVDWAEREQHNFTPVVRAARDLGLDGHAWRLALVLWSAKAPSAVAAEWLEIGEIGLAAARRVGERLAEAELSQNLGFAHVKMNRMREALEYHNNALTVRHEQEDLKGEALSLNAIGVAYLRWRRIGDAETYLKRARIAFQGLGAPHWDAVVAANLAAMYYDAGSLDDGQDYSREALDRYRADGDMRGMGGVLNILSGIHRDLGELDQALDAASQAHDIALDLRSHVLEGYWLLALGDAQRALGQLSEALTSYHRSAVLHRRLGDRNREALAWRGAGDVYRLLDRADEAAAFHRRATEVQRELGYAWDEAEALDGLALDLRASDPEQSRGCWNAALRLLADYPDPRATRLRRRIENDLAGLSQE
ncbi:MAG TPA: tetratricopeptide repeat protein [Pseudonocardiaceae bacterium]